MDVEVELTDLEMTLLAEFAAEMGMTLEEFFVAALNEYVAKHKKQ